MNDDFNSPIVISKLFDAVKMINSIKEGKLKISTEDIQELKNSMSAFLFDILGLIDAVESNSVDTDKLSGTIDLLIKLRAEARMNKNFALSDQIRDQLAEIGIQLKDGKEGTSFSLN